MEVATKCSKCGGPFVAGQTIEGHETATWHARCPEPQTPPTDDADDTSLLSLPGAQMEYPKHESDCHGAPVYLLKNQIRKYVCIECGEYCIARQKK